MIQLLYSRASRPTGEHLANALSLAQGRRIISDTEYLIRWGCISDASRDDDLYVLNRASSIQAASDKLGSLEVLRDNEILVPRFSTDPGLLSYPFLGRRRNHSQGSDITLCLNRRDYERDPRDYYVEYIPTRAEFRVHVFRGEAIRIQIKSPARPELHKPWVRNHGTGYVYQTPRRRLRAARIQSCVEAVAALNLDFGAVDLLLGDDEEHYVLEVNTAPSCSPKTASAYCGAFSRTINTVLPGDVGVLIPDDNYFVEMVMEYNDDRPEDLPDDD